jgi:hypothetical protein
MLTHRWQNAIQDPTTPNAPWIGLSLPDMPDSLRHHGASKYHRAQPSLATTRILFIPHFIKFI